MTGASSYRCLTLGKLLDVLNTHSLPVKLECQEGTQQDGERVERCCKVKNRDISILLGCFLAAW